MDATAETAQNHFGIYYHDFFDAEELGDVQKMAKAIDGMERVIGKSLDRTKNLEDAEKLALLLQPRLGAESGIINSETHYAKTVLWMARFSQSDEEKMKLIWYCDQSRDDVLNQISRDIFKEIFSRCRTLDALARLYACVKRVEHKMRIKKKMLEVMSAEEKADIISRRAYAVYGFTVKGFRASCTAEIAKKSLPRAVNIPDWIKEIMLKKIDALPEIKKVIIVMKYGLDGNNRKTLRTIACELKIEFEKTRNLFKAAWNTLREDSEVANLGLRNALYRKETKRIKPDEEI